MNNVFITKGKNPGPTVSVIGGVHGNEVCGVETIRKFSNSLQIECGTIQWILGNPLAIERRVRQTDTNLNRMFKDAKDLSAQELSSYERKRAEELMEYLDKSDAMLDIHSSASPSSIPFVICEPHSFEVARTLPVSIISYGWDALEPGGTDHYMNRQNKIGICIECGYHDDPSAKNIAEVAISSFLASLGLHLGVSGQTQAQRFIKVQEIYKTKTNFTPTKMFADFEYVAKDSVIGTDGEAIVKMPYDGSVVFVRERKSPGEEAFLIGV